MKTKNVVCVLAIFLIGTQLMQAQFLKKLQKRAGQKVENVISDKIADKAAEKAAKSMEDMLNVNPFVSAGGMKGNPELIADAYEFSWKYSLKMTTKDGDMVFDYYLEPEASYFGFSTAAYGTTNMFTVMDSGKEVMAMFMKSEDNNMGIVTAMPKDLDVEDEMPNYTVEPLPDKIIKGYHCKGMKVLTDEYEMTMYLTDESEVSLVDVFKNGKTKIPVKFQDYFNPDDKVLMISMDAKSLKKEKYNMTMECVGFEKVSKTIKKSDYKFM
jgi:hypothetical protein